MTTHVGKTELFLSFLKIGLMGFGGVAPMAHHVIVEDRRWLTEEDYAAVLGLGQIIPGANVVNATVMIGDRFQGPFGSLVAVGGLMVVPLCILMAMAMLFDRFGTVPAVGAAIGGSAAAAAGLVIGTAIKMARRLRPSLSAGLFGTITFIAIGLLRAPLIPTILLLGPLSIAVAFAARRQ